MCFLSVLLLPECAVLLLLLPECGLLLPECGLLLLLLPECDVLLLPECPDLLLPPILLVLLALSLEDDDEDNGTDEEPEDGLESALDAECLEVSTVVLPVRFAARVANPLKGRDTDRNILSTLLLDV